MYNFVKGNRLFMKGSREEDDPDNVADPNEVDLVNDHAVERQQYDFNSKNHMASAAQESREVFRTTHNRNGLKTVHTQKVLKKTTSVNRGEQKKLPTYSMLEGNKLKEKLMRWARKSTRGYPHVEVTDFTNSWRDGLALNAIIHRNRPDLVDFHKCQESSARDNLSNAFRVLEKNFGIKPILDPDQIARGDINEDEMVKYLSAVYEVFPDPPEHNPLWDAEKIRRIDEYKDLASRLLVWLRDNIPKLKERNFPNTIQEMLQLKEANRLFRVEQIPPRLHDKQRLASSYEDVLNMARALPGKHVKIEDEYNIANIEHLWNQMIKAHQERDHAIDSEIAKLEKLERIAEDLIKEIDICDNNLDSIKKRIILEEQRVHKIDPLKHNPEIDEIQWQLKAEEDRIKNMYDTLKYLADHNYHRVNQLRNQVDYLHNKLKNLKITFENNVVKVFNDRRAEALRKPKTEEELIRENPKFKFLHDCIQWVLEKRQYLEGLSLGEDAHSIQRRLEQFNEANSEIHHFQDKVDQCQSQKRDIKPEELPIYQNMLSRLLDAYEDLKSFCGKRINDLKSLLEFVKLADKELAWISAKEEIEISRDWSLKNLNLEDISKYHYTLLKEMENRERDFISVQDRGESLIRSRHPSTKFIESLMAKMQYNWSWLLQLINCLEEHLRYTGDYYNFMEDVNDTKKQINTFEDKLNNQYSRQHFLIEEGHKMQQEMLTLKDDIAKISDKISELEDKSGTIVNMKQRKAPLPRPIKVKSLCMIKNEQTTVTKNEMVTLLDNSQRLKWKVRTQNNVELSIPSVCFVIPPPDPDILDALAELKAKQEALIALWAQKYRDLRLNIILSTLKTVKDWDYPTYCSMDPQKRDGILKMLEDDINKLAREGPPDDPKVRRLQDELDAIKKKFADFEDRKRREEEERKNQEKIQKFIEAVNDVLEKLQEKERILIQRCQAQIPRDRESLQRLIIEHNEFEHDLSMYESKIKSLKEEFSKITNKSHAAQSKYEAIIETWDRLCTLSKHYFERLKALEVVLDDIEAANSTLASVQSKLVLHEEVPADEMDLKRMHAELSEVNANSQHTNAAFEQLLSNVTKVRRLVERTRPKQATHSDLNRLEEDVKTLYKKWKSAHTQINERLSGLELCRDLLRKYRSLMDTEKAWLSQTSAKVKTMLTRSDLDQVTRIYESIVERKPAIEDTNVAGNRFISEAKNLNVKIKNYRDSLDEQLELSAKRARKYEGVEVVERELEMLNSEYKSLLDQVLSYLNQLQDDKTRLREFNRATKQRKQNQSSRVASQRCLTNYANKMIALINRRGQQDVHLSERDLQTLYKLLTKGERLGPLYGRIMSMLIQRWSLRHIPLLTGAFLNRLQRTMKRRQKRLALLASQGSLGSNASLSPLGVSYGALTTLLPRSRRSKQQLSQSQLLTLGQRRLLTLSGQVKGLLLEARLLVLFGNDDADDNRSGDCLHLSFDEASMNALKRNICQSCQLNMTRTDKDKVLDNSKAAAASSLSQQSSSTGRDKQNALNVNENALPRKLSEHSIADKLRSWLDQKDKLISVLGPIGSEPYMVNTQLKQIHVMKDEFSSQEHLLNKMDKLGDSILERMNRSDPEHKVIQNKMNDIHKLWKQLLAILDEREKNLLSVNEAAADFQNKLNKLQSNLDAISNDFDHITSSGMDNDEQLLKITNLEENLEAQRPLLAECGNACNNLCNLLTDNASKNEIKDRFKLVENKYNDLCKKIANKKAELQSTLKEDREFFMSCDELQEWLRNMLNLLSKDIKISAILDIVIKQINDFEPIFRQVMDKEHEVHMVLNRGNNILSKASHRNDAANWRHTLDNVKRQWDLVKKEAIEKNTKLHKCLDICRKFNNAYNDLYPLLKQYEHKLHSFKDISLHRNDLERQFRDIQFMKNDISKHHQDFDNLRNLADSLLSIADTDKEHIRDQMSKLKELWDHVNNEVLKLHQQLDSILHKYIQYKDNLRDFVHNLQRIEDKALSHESFADQKMIDHFRNLLDEARSLRHFLDTIKNLAADLIAEVQNEASTMSIKNEVKDVEDRYNRLLAKLEEKCKNLDILSNNLKAFNLQLADIQNELNRLEERLNNMEPIARDLNTLKMQLEDIKDFRNSLKKVHKSLKDAENLYKTLKEQNHNIDSSVNKFHLDNLNRQYARLDENSNQRLNNILAMIDKVKAFDDDVDGVNKNLNDVTRDFDRLKPISSDLGVIRSQQAEFKDFLNHNVDPLSRKIDDLKRKGNGLIQSAGPGVDTGKIEKDIDQINGKWNNLKDKINDRVRKLDVAMMQAGRFKDALEAFEKWLRETEQMMAQQKPPSSDYKEVKAQIQEQQFIKKMLSDRESSLHSLNEMGKEFMKNLDNNERYQIENQLGDLSRRFEQLKVNCNNRLKTLEQILPVAKAFLDKVVTLTEWLDGSERKLNMLKHSIAVDQDSIKNKLQEHRALHQDILNHKGEFEMLTDIAQNLMSMVSDDEAQIVVDKFKELTDRYAKLVEDSANFGDQLNESNEILRNFMLNFDDLFEWIAKMDARVNKHRIAGVTVEQIKEQIDEMLSINQEIKSNEHKVHEVVTLGQNFMRNMSGQDSIFIKQKSDQLQFKFNELKRKAADYLANLKEVLPIAQNFYNAHDKLNSWFDIAERSLKNLESQSLKEQESTIHTLESQIKENKSLLDVVNNLGPQFCQYTPGQGTATIEGIVIKDNRRFNNICEQINRQVDKIDSWKQKNDELVTDIDELFEWFKDAERQLREAEGISHEPPKLILQLKETKALYDDINSQKGRVRDILLNVKKLVRNSNNEDMIHIREKSEELKDLANHVSQLCQDRLNLLEQALPLAEHFFEAYNELSHWLDDAENEAQMLGSAANAIQIRRMQDIINNLNRAINEHKPVVDKLNKTGQSLANIVQERDAKQVRRLMDNINERYNNLKGKLREQQMALDSALQATSQFSDKMDGLLKALENILDQLKNAEPISAHPERIQEQIYDNNAILDDLDKRRNSYETVSQNARDILNKAGKDEPSVRDIANKLNKLNDNWKQCNTLANNRKNALNDALRIATKFWEQLNDCLKSLKDIEYALNSEEPPACEPNAVYRQQETLKEIRREMDQTKQKIDDCKATGRDLIKVCSDHDKHEVKKNMDDLDSIWNNVSNLYNKREKDLKEAMQRAVKFHEALQQLLEFLDSAEETFANMGPVASDLGAVKSQMNELNNFKKHVDSHIKHIENFNRLANDLLESVSSSQAKSIREPLNEVNHRWDDLLKAIANRQAELENALLKLGQFEQSLNDFLEWMRKTERTLDEIKPVFADPQILEVELAKFKVLLNDILAHQSTVDTLNSAGKMLIENERGSENARNTQNKLNNLNSKWQQLLDKAEQRRRELEELLKEAHSFNQELLDSISWINDMDNELSVSKPVGGLPETAKEQLARFMEFYNEIESNRFRIESLLDRGNEYLKRAKEAPNLQHNMKTLKSKWDSLLAKANDKKIKLEIALAEAIEFHNSLENFIQWLTEAEKYLNNLQPVSRVLERITEQIEEHKKFQKDLSDHRETMLDLDKKGTHLKYFSQKQDVILIKNLLVSVQHRWEKVLSKAAERSRNLDYGLRETKEFYDAWNDLMSWLTELEKNFDSEKQLSNNPEVIRQLIQKHREFQRQLGSKHSQYDNTLKMGKHLKEKAPKIDHPIIQNMIDELKNKWNSICNKSVDRQRKLEEALLFSGQFKDAIDALMDWLEKVKNQLQLNASVYGDLDTVTALVEQHKIFLEEFKRREKNLQSVHRISEELLRTAQSDDSFNIKAEISALNELWKEVETLSHERSVELEKAIVEAEKLHKAVHVLLEWLSDAEMKLRFSGPLPEDEETTRDQIEEHDVFMKEMEIHEKNKEGTVSIAQDILQKCHPEAAPVIKHWITIIQSRWEEVNSWAKQREQRLNDHLKSLLDIMDSLEKLLAWLIGAEAALLAAETQPLPDDNFELEKLIEDHVTFIEELEKKGIDVDKIVKTFVSKKQALANLKSKEERQGKRGGLLRSSTPIKIQHEFGSDVKHPKVKELVDKYSKVKKLAQDRMKRLQDKLDYNNEVERVKHFDFDDWRRRFLGWMNNKKARIIDFFKRIDTNNDGRVTKSEFVEGFVCSKFTTSRLEMEKVVDTFDRNNDGYIDYKEYMDTLRPERDIPKTESEIIQDEVQKQVDKCTCMDKYKVAQVGECKYRFGESQKLRLVRILRSTVMVRVGGGWVSLDEFLHKHDPCRLKGRTNIELREQLNDFTVEGKPKSLYNEDGTISSVGPITKIKEKTERSLPMSAHDQLRFNSTSDYSFSDQADSSGAKSRPRSRLTASSNSRPGSQPPSRACSDLSIESLDSYNQKGNTYKFVTKSSSTKKLSNSRQGSMNNLRDKLK